MHYESPIREPLILEDKTLHDITEDVARPIEGKANKWWWALFLFSLSAFLVGRRLLSLHSWNRNWCVGVK